MKPIIIHSTTQTYCRIKKLWNIIVISNPLTYCKLVKNFLQSLGWDTLEHHWYSSDLSLLAFTFLVTWRKSFVFIRMTNPFYKIDVIVSFPIAFIVLTCVVIYKIYCYFLASDKFSFDCPSYACVQLIPSLNIIKKLVDEIYLGKNLLLYMFN